MRRSDFDENWMEIGQLGFADTEAAAPAPTLRGDRFTYVVLAPRSFGRLHQKSELLYVGQGTRGRVSSLWTGKHSALRALRHAASDRWDRLVVLGRRWDESDAGRRAVLEEARLLTREVREHGEPPPANGRWEGYVLGRVLGVIAGTLGEGGGLVGPYDWPTEEPAVTWVDIYSVDNAFIGSVGWEWPKDGPGGQPSSGGALVWLTYKKDMEQEQPPLPGWCVKQPDEKRAKLFPARRFHLIESDDNQMTAVLDALASAGDAGQAECLLAGVARAADQ